MERTRFDDHPCPIARAANIFGDWWVPMLLREAMYGVENFNDFQENLGISRNILNQRLKRLVEMEIFEKVAQEGSARHAYRLTGKGRDALEILAVMSAWSNRWVFDEDDYPIELSDRRTGRRVKPALIDENTGEKLNFENLVLGPGPGFPNVPEVREWRFGPSGRVAVQLGDSL